MLIVTGIHSSSISSFATFAWRLHC